MYNVLNKPFCILPSVLNYTKVNFIFQHSVLLQTTTTTTTTTERPKEFWEDPLTVVWLEFAFALLAALCVFIVILSIRHCPMGSKADQSK